MLGDIIHVNSEVFGPAVIEAHDIESNDAVYPRIIISDSVVEFIRNNTSLIQYADKWIRKDFDGKYFIDFLNAPPLQVDCPKSPTGQMISKACFLDWVINKYSVLLRDENEKTISKKYTWLIAYAQQIIGNE